MTRTFSKDAGKYLTFTAGTLNGLISGAAKVFLHCFARYNAALSSAANSNNRLLSISLDSVTGAGLLLNVRSTGVINAAARSSTADSLQTQTSVATLSQGVTYSVAAEYNFAGDSITPYLNGTASGGGAVTFAAESYTPGSPTAADAIGGDDAPPNTNNQWPGYIDRVSIWTGTASASASDLCTALETTPANEVSVTGWTLAEYFLLMEPSNRETGVVASTRAAATGILPYFPPLISYEPTDDVLFAEDSFTGSQATIDGRTPDASGSNWALASYSTGSGCEVDGSGALRGVFAGSNAAEIAYINEELPNFAVWCEAVVEMLTAEGIVTILARLRTAEETGIGISLSQSANQVRVVDHAAGTVTGLASGAYTWATNTQYTVRMMCGYKWVAGYVGGKLIVGHERDSTAHIGTRGRIGIRISGSTAGTSSGWRIHSFKVYRQTPKCRTLAIGTLGGGSGPQGYHNPRFEKTTTHLLCAAVSRIGSNDYDPHDTFCWRIPLSDIADGSWLTGSYSPVTILGDGTSASYINLLPLLIVDPDDRATVRSMTVYYPNTTAFNTPIAGHTGNTALVRLSTSTDGGATWGTAVDITSSVKNASAYRITIGPGRPVELSDGTILVAYSESIGGYAASDRQAGLLVSTDGGATWSPSTKHAHTERIEQAPVELWPSGSGTVMMNIRSHFGGVVHYRAYTDDNGASWHDDTLDEPGVYDATTDADGNFHPTSRGWRASDIMTLHNASDIREHLQWRYSATNAAIDEWNNPATTDRHVLSGWKLSDGWAGYSDLYPVNDDTLAVIWGGGEENTVVERYQQALYLMMVPRTWLGLNGPAPSSGTASKSRRATIRPAAGPACSAAVYPAVG